MERFGAIGFGSVLLVYLMSGEFPLQSRYYDATRRADAAMISERERFTGALASRVASSSVFMGCKCINY